MKVLWIDDDLKYKAPYLKILRKLVSEHQIDLEYAASATKAYEKITSQKYDLIIIDLIIPFVINSEVAPIVVQRWNRSKNGDQDIGIGLIKWLDKFSEINQKVIILSIADQTIPTPKTRNLEILARFDSNEIDRETIQRFRDLLFSKLLGE